MPTKKDQNGEKYRKADLKKGQTTEILHLHQSFGTHPSRGLTPQRLNAILQEAERGQWQSQFDLFEDMEQRWTHLFAECDKLKRLVMSLDYEVHPPDKPTPEEERTTEQVAEAIDALPDLEDLFFDMLDGVGKGFSPIEIVRWDYDGKWQLPFERHKRPQSWFTHDRETRTELRLRNQRSVDGEPLKPLQWIVHVHRARSTYLAEAPLYRSLVWVYLYFMYASRDHAERNEIFGKPIIVAKYPSQASDPEKAALYNAIKGIGRNARGAISDQMQIELLSAAQSSSDPFTAMIRWCESSVSKALLYGTLTSQADGKTSTNALGDVHSDMFRDRVQSVARQLESTLRHQLIAPIVHLNVGHVAPNRLPRIRFDAAPKEDQDAFMSRMIQAVSVGVPVPIRFVQEKINVPEPVGDEPVLLPQFVAVAPAKTTDADKLAAGETEDNRDLQNEQTPSQGTGAPKKGSPAATLRALFDTFANTDHRSVQAMRARGVDPGPATPYTTRLASEGAAGFAQMIQALKSLAENAESLDALRTELALNFADLPDRELQNVMGVALAAADLGGRAKADDDAKKANEGQQTP